MYSASIIAKEFVKKANDLGRPITQMQLQKMLYFAQGYYLAKYDESLIKEGFQAWKFGPVIPRIYDIYKFFGSYPITSNPDYFTFEQEVCPDETAMESVEYTWNATSHLTAMQLSNWTHLEGSPWAKAYKPNDTGIFIDNDVIKDYFKKFLFNNAPAA